MIYFELCQIFDDNVRCFSLEVLVYTMFSCYNIASIVHKGFDFIFQNRLCLVVFRFRNNY